MRVGYFQFCPKWGDPLFNRKAILKRLSSLEEGEVDLLVLPELCLSGYHFKDEKQLLPYTHLFGDSFFEPLHEVAKEKGIALVLGFAEREEVLASKASDVKNKTLLFNSSLLLLPSGQCHLYRKNHLFGKEKELFSPGNLGYPIFEWKGVKIGLLVCFDHMFPEAARTLALAGAQIICHSSNLVLSGYANITSRSRALENRVFWILANRYGQEGHLKFSGESRIVGPLGDVLASAPAYEDALKILTIDPLAAVDKALFEHNHLFDDRRTDSYKL